MAIDITYKGDSLASFGSGTKTMKTAGKYMEDDVTITVPSGSAATPATTVTANPTISVSSGGLITATTSTTKSVTPSVSEGWVASGTAGTITVSGSKTSQLSTQAAKTVTPTTSEQTAVASGKYTTGAIKVAAIPSKYKDTTNADAVAADVLSGKVFVNGTGEVTGAMTNNGAVSKTLDATTNNQSYTVPAGYHNGSGTVSITLETKTATPSTSSQNITPTSGKVLSKVTVNAMPSGTAGTPDIQLGVISNHVATLYPWVQNTTGYITGGTKTGSAYTISASQLTSGTKSISANGTGIDVTNYSSVNVNVPIPEPEIPTKKRINFVDYDGTILYSYWYGDWESVTSLPSNPSHEGLTAQGWNWTKAQIDEQLMYSGDSEIWVGQVYTPESLATKIHIYLEEGRTHPYLGIGLNGLAEISWGDWTDWETVTGSSTSTVTYIDHEYEGTGEFTIEISVSTGNVVLFGDQYVSNTLRKDTTSTTIDKHRVYANAIRRVEIGANTGLGTYAFCNCTSLESITIPSDVTSIGSGAFKGCCSLKGLTIPSGVTSVGTHLCADCTSLRTVSLPSSITQIGVYAFDGCGSLEGVGLPNSVTSIGNNAFSGCSSFTFIVTPTGLTSLGVSAFANCRSLRELYFVDEVETIPPSALLNCRSLSTIWLGWSTTTIEESAFSGCLSLASVYVPEVETIGNYAFADCYGVTMYHFYSETPPTLGTNVFQNIQPDCKIYVPSASVSAYKTATNWSAYASYIEADPDE